jgi:hypothetical protein
MLTLVEQFGNHIVDLNSIDIHPSIINNLKSHLEDTLDILLKYSLSLYTPYCKI